MILFDCVECNFLTLIKCGVQSLLMPWVIADTVQTRQFSNERIATSHEVRIGSADGEGKQLIGPWV